MQIHELNNFTGTLGSGAYLAIDDGTDTGKISSQGLLAATEARIDNIIAGPAPSAEEIVDARLGADGVTYPSLGDAIRDQFTDVKSDLSDISDDITGSNFYYPTHYGKCFPEVAPSYNTININTPTVSAEWNSYLIPCFAQDVFTIYAVGGLTTKAWAFVDSSGNELSESVSNVNVNGDAVTAPANSAYLVVNDKGLNSRVYKGNLNETRQTAIKDRIDFFTESFADSLEGVQTFYGFGNFQHCGLNTDGSFKVTQKYRVSNDDPMTFDRDIKISVANGFKWGYIPFVGGTAGSWAGWFTTDVVIPANTSFVVQIARATEDTSEIADVYEFLRALTFDTVSAEYTNKISISNSFAKHLDIDIVSSLVWEQGSYNSSGAPSVNLSTIRTPLIDVLGVQKLIIAPTGYKVGWHLYDETKTHISSADAYITNKFELSVGRANYVAFNIRNADDSSLNPSGFDPTKLAIKISYDEKPSYILGECATSDYSGHIEIKNSFKHTLYINGLKTLFTPSATLPSRRQQGTAIYNGIMFNLFDKGGLSILDLKEREVINEYTLDIADEENHCNSAGFSNEFYSGNTDYPLLYISECYGNHRCFVENVTDESAELIQTITFNNANGDYSNSTWGVAFDWIIDSFAGKLMTYGVMSDGKHKIKVFNIPDTSVASVALTEEDVIEQWIVEDYARSGFSYTYQGWCAKGGKLYLVCYNPNKIICVDEHSHQITAEVDLDFISGEPEGADIDDGILFLTTWHSADTTVYAMQFNF